MSTKKKTKRQRPMRLWLVRDVDPDHKDGGELWLVQSRDVPWLYEDWQGKGVWLPLDGVCLVDLDKKPFQHDIKPGYCVELREVR